MRSSLGRLAFAVVLVGSVISSAVPVRAQTGPPDSTLYTNYIIDTVHANLTWIVCGNTQGSSGCYAAGSLGPFGKIGALLEGVQQANLATHTVARLIYVLDVAGGPNQDQVILYAYRKTDVVGTVFDTVTVSLSKTITLPLVGGTSAAASMAANTKFLFVGTDQSPDALRIQKNNYAITPFGGFSPPVNVSAITADAYGYVTVSYGSFNSSSSANIVIGPDGNSRSDGGGALLMLNTVQAVLPSTLQ